MARARRYSTRSDDRPSVQWYYKDWLSDAALSRCSLAAQGFWMNLVCAGYGCAPKGVLSGSVRALAGLGKCTYEDDPVALLRALHEAGVYSWLGPDGALMHDVAPDWSLDEPVPGAVVVNRKAYRTWLEEERARQQRRDAGKASAAKRRAKKGGTGVAEGDGPPSNQFEGGTRGGAGEEEFRVAGPSSNQFEGGPGRAQDSTRFNEGGYETPTKRQRNQQRNGNGTGPVKLGEILHLDEALSTRQATGTGRDPTSSSSIANCIFSNRKSNRRLRLRDLGKEDVRTLSSSAVVLVCAGLEEGYDRKPTDADRAAQGLSPSVKTQEDHLRMWAARLRTVESKRGGYSHVRDLLVKLWLAEHPELRADVGLPNNRAAWLNGEITKFLAASEPRAEVEA